MPVEVKLIKPFKNKMNSKTKPQIFRLLEIVQCSQMTKTALTSPPSSNNSRKRSEKQ